MKMMKETPCKLLKDEQNKQLGKNNESKMTLYNSLPRKEYERVFICKTAKEVWHILIITHQAKVTREQTSNDSDSQGGSDNDVDEEEAAEAFNLMARNFRKFFRKGNRFRYGNRLLMVPIGLKEATEIALGTKAMKAQGKRKFAIIVG
uniref:Zf-CCHC domain-containing protein/DUF4219 domain-containing protein/UBN2 domain-containing protein n=1 Tax=Tanacetum cinerariifolium TaxID=118510 RepID=A0A6L2LYL6_TANCI|nr:zf-CCHC domain-containing protein/DUF4219 domain-containing protein/UBN2 domain-containing protein [Tanacetum cinerariifolium]